MKRKIILLFGLFILIGAGTIFGKSSLFVWITDMYNQKSIKPQEEGSMIDFPIGSVSTDGRIYENYENRFDWLSREMSPKTTTRNPIKSSAESLANGEFKYKTYCAVCHGITSEANEDGFAKTQVNSKGMVAPIISDLSPAFSDGYIYHKIRYGGAVMPPIGIATTSKDRWDIVNFVRLLEKKHDQE
ncbi:MAG: cytochrome c [Deltaproteobacteria bacterium]|nr:cytochrome c [Deltaproteobacteria bacterium]